MMVVKVALLRLSLTVLFLLQVLVLTTTSTATNNNNFGRRRGVVQRSSQQQQQRKVSGKRINSISSESVFSQQRSFTPQSSIVIVSSIQGQNTERLLAQNKVSLGFHQKSTTGRKRNLKKMKSKKKHDDSDDDYYYHNDNTDEKDDPKKEEDEEDKAIQAVIDNLQNFESTIAPQQQKKQYPPTISPSVQQKETIQEPVVTTTSTSTTTTNIPLQSFHITVDQQINETELRNAIVEYLATTMMVSTTSTESSVSDSIQLIGSPANTISNTFHYNGTLVVVMTTSNISTKAGSSSSSNDVWLLKQSLALQDIQSLLKSLNKSPSIAGSMEFNRATVVFENDSNTNDIDIDTTALPNDESTTSSSTGSNIDISNSTSINYPTSDFSDVHLSSPTNGNVDSLNTNNQQNNNTTTNLSDATKDSSSINTNVTTDQEEASRSFIQSENFLWIIISSIAFMILLFVFGCSFYYIHEKRRIKSEKYISVNELEENARYIYDFDDVHSDDFFVAAPVDSNISTKDNKKKQKQYSTDGEVRKTWSGSSSSSSSDSSTSSSSNKKKPIFRLPDDPIYYLNTKDPRQILCTTTSGSTANQQQQQYHETTIVKVLDTNNNNDDDDDDDAASDDVMTYHTSSAYSLAFQCISCISPLTRTSVNSNSNNNNNTSSVTGTSITGTSLKHDVFHQRQYHGGSRRSRAVVRSVGSLNDNQYNNDIIYNDHGNIIIPSITTPSVTDNDSVTDVVSLQGMNNTGRSARSTHWDNMSSSYHSDCSDIISTSSKSDSQVPVPNNGGTTTATTNDDDNNYVNTNTNIYHFTKATLVSNTNNNNILSSSLLLSSPASTISLTTTSSCRRKKSSSSVSFSNSTPKQQQHLLQKENATNGIYNLASTPEQSIFAFNDDAGSTISSIHLPPSVH